MERREFLKTGLAAAATGPFVTRALGAGDPVRLGLVGVGSRGSYELECCSRIAEAKIVAVADVYQPYVDRVVKPSNGAITGYQDFRRILERKDIDAVIVSTPDHWHAPITIMACQAGKDVFCEKPLSHTIHEGRTMVQAARKYNRIVQTGSQQRSAPHFQKIVKLVQDGYIGKVTAVDCWNTQSSLEGSGNPPDSDPPKGMDWDMYLGAAPKVAYNPNRFTWNYRWFWDYSGGIMTDWGAHHMDIIQWAMQVDGPSAAVSSGGRFFVKDNTQTPDTLMTVFEYPGFIVRFNFRQANARRFEGRPNGVCFFGTKGTLVVDRGSWEVIPETTPRFPSDYDRISAMAATGNIAQPLGFNRDTGPQPQPRCAPLQESGIHMDPAVQEVHIRNFLECVRTRQTPVADVETGHRSCSACLVGVISYRLGRKVHYDPKLETFPNDAEARAMLTKKYRAPWTLPAV